MTKERINEIGYLLLVQLLTKQGILFNTTFKDLLDTSAKQLKVSESEMQKFAIHITGAVVSGAATEG